MENGREFRKLFGRKLHILRTKRGMTQMQLAASLGYNSTGMVSQIEKGIKGMASAKVVQAAKILRVSPAFLFSNERISNESIELLVMVNEIINNPESLKYQMAQTFFKSLMDMPEPEAPKAKAA